MLLRRRRLLDDGLGLRDLRALRSAVPRRGGEQLGHEPDPLRPDHEEVREPGQIRPAIERAREAVQNGKPALVNIWVDIDVWAPGTKNQTMYK